MLKEGDFSSTFGTPVLKEDDFSSTFGISMLNNYDFVFRYNPNTVVQKLKPKMISCIFI